MTGREIDWQSYLNGLVYCHGCGRFAFPLRTAKGPRPPRGWTMLYQPHADAPPLLLGCGEACVGLLREAIQKGPVWEPLKTAENVLMPADVREAMLADVRAQLEAEVEETEDGDDDAEEHEGPIDLAAHRDRAR